MMFVNVSLLQKPVPYTVMHCTVWPVWLDLSWEPALRCPFRMMCAFVSHRTRAPTPTLLLTDARTQLFCLWVGEIALQSGAQKKGNVRSVQNNQQRISCLACKPFTNVWMDAFRHSESRSRPGTVVGLEEGRWNQQYRSLVSFFYECVYYSL